MSTSHLPFLDKQSTARARRGPEVPGKAFTRRQAALLAAITLLAAALRLCRLGEWSFWIDEAITWRDATYPDDVGHPAGPGYRSGSPFAASLLAWVLEVGLLPSTGEGWLRLPFAFAGIATVPLLAVAGAPFVGRSGALLAALFLAVHPWHLFWSQNVRGYVFACFFALLGCALYRAAVERGRWSLVSLATLAMLVAAGFHATALLLLPVYALAPSLMAHQSGDRRGALRLLWLAATLLFATIALVWSLPWFASFVHGKPADDPLHFVETAAWCFRLPLLAAAAAGGFLLLSDSGARAARARFLVAWAALPLILCVLLGAFVGKTTARYALPALPAVLLLAAAAARALSRGFAAALPGAGRLARLPAALLALLLLADLAAYDWLYFTAHHGDRGRWRAACDEALAAAGERSLTVLTWNQPSAVYYLRRDHWIAHGRRDPHPEVRVEAMTPWAVFGGTTNGGAVGGTTNGGAVGGAPNGGAGGGAEYLRGHVAAAAAEGRALVVLVTPPELAELDRDGSLRRTLAGEFALAQVLPQGAGPRDETILVYRPVSGSPSSGRR